MADAKPPFLKGEQIYLRGVDPSDTHGAYIEWVNDREITQYLETGYFPSDVEAVESYIEEMNGDDDVLFLAIVAAADDTHVGNIKLGPIDWIHRRGDIGLLVGERDYWGEGIGTEAIGLVVRHAFERLNLHKLTAGCYEQNVGSKRAFEKNGFEVEGRRRDHAAHGDGYADLLLLGLLAEEYERLREG